MSEFNHHGIDGQKWGVKNGPPYPLDAEEHKKVVKQKKKEMRETAKQIRKRLSKNYLSLGIGEKSAQRDREMGQLIRTYYTQKVDYLNTKDIEKGKNLLINILINHIQYQLVLDFLTFLILQNTMRQKLIICIFIKNIK